MGMFTTIPTITAQRPMFEDFMLRAALAGIGVALAAGPLGCFVVWRRMAYFGDATAHASILGVALALALSVSPFLGVLAIALLMALTMGALAGRGYGPDTLLGVLAHTGLALGLVAASLAVGVQVDLMAFLIGDILAVGTADLGIIWGGATLVLALLAWRWRALLTATLNADLAFASGLPPRREEMVLTLALAVVVAVAIKVVGALLITAMLIIPAAAARPLARTPEMMAALAAIIGAIAAISGLAVSYLADTPTGPSIVVAAAVLFAAINIAAKLKPRVTQQLDSSGPKP
jgi:zinc transport system permease protein